MLQSPIATHCSPSQEGPKTGHVVHKRSIIVIEKDWLG